MAVCSGGRFCLSAPGCSCWRLKQRFGVGHDGYGHWSWKPPGSFLAELAGPGPSHGGPRASSSLLSCRNQEERCSALGWRRRDRNAAGFLSGLQSGDVLPSTHTAPCDAQGPLCRGPSAARVPTSQGKGGQEEAQPRSPWKRGQRVWAQGLLTLLPGLCRSRHTLTVPVMSPGAVACSATPLVLSALQGCSTCPSPSASLPAAGRSPVSRYRQDEGHPPAGGGRGSAKAKEIVLRNSCKELGQPLRMRSCRKWH